MKDCTSDRCYAEECEDCFREARRGYIGAVVKVINGGMTNGNCSDVSSARNILALIGYESIEVSTLTNRAKKEAGKCRDMQQLAS